MIGRDGIDDTYDSATGPTRAVDSRVLDQIRAAIGSPADDPATERGAPIVVRAGSRGMVGQGFVELEDGGRMSVAGALPAELPLGYHRFLGDSGEHALIVAPERCHVPERAQGWGWATQLYAARSRQSWGIGDLGDLATVARWSAVSRSSRFAGK